MAFGLRPNPTLPPEPVPYGADGRPLASRTDGDDDDAVIVVHVSD